MRLCLACRATFSGSTWRCPACGHDPVQIFGFPAFAPELALDNSGMPPEANHRLALLQEKSFWFRSRNRLIQDLVTTYSPDADTFMEVGAGSGFVLSGLQAVLPHCHFVASEIYSNGLSYAARRLKPHCDFIQADALHLPYRSEFDAVGAFDVLEHIDFDERALAEVLHVLKPGGTLFLTVPQHPWLWSHTDEVAFHRRRYRKGELAQKVERAGYRVVFQTSFAFFLLPVMIAKRMLSGGRCDEPLGSELSLPLVIDRCFEGVLELERLLIRIRLSLPAGGSQIVVARKEAGACA